MKRTQIPTWQEIQAMSDEEVRALNRELAVQAFRRFLYFQLLKWGAIFAISYAARRYIEREMKG